MPDDLTINDIQDRIIDEMSSLNNGLARYEYLIGLGRNLPVPYADIRTDANAMPGCQSSVWIVAEMNHGRMNYKVDSDSLITRGMLALLLRVVNNRPAHEIAGCDLYFLERIGLRSHLSPSRANGLSAMVNLLQGAAVAALSADESFD